jgi:plastocyanin
MTRVLRLGLLVPLAMCFALLCSLTPAADAAGSAVSIQGFAFHPASITVPVGSTITWTNQDSAPHTATAKDGSFDTGTLQQGQSMTITFSKAGTYAYYCQFHPFMRGTVTVTAAAPTAAPAPAVATQTMRAVQTTVAPVATTPAIPTTVPASNAAVTRTVQATSTPAPMPGQMPSTGAGGSANVWRGSTLAGLLALALGSLLVARKRA